MEQALPGWAAAWQEASSSRNRGRGRFQSPLPETETPFLDLDYKSVSEISFPVSQLGNKGRELSAVRETASEN